MQLFSTKIFDYPINLFFFTGGGCGKELANWIIHGRPELDMYR